MRASASRARVRSGARAARASARSRRSSRRLAPASGFGGPRAFGEQRAVIVEIAVERRAPCRRPPARAGRRPARPDAGRGVISRTAPSKSASAFTSASRASMSRWLVGSSRISSCGASRVASASSSRAFSPPDRFATGVSARSASRPKRASWPRTCGAVARGSAARHVGERRFVERPARRSGAARSSRRAACGRAGSRRPAAPAGRRAASPRWTCRCRWRRAARSGRPCRSSATGRAAPAGRHSRPRPAPAPGSAARCGPAPGRRSGSARPRPRSRSAAAAASALIRACAWRALLAL